MKSDTFRFFVVFLSVASALGMGACTSVPLKSKETGVRFIGDQKVDQYVLKNGLKLIVLEDRASPTFAFQTWFDVGSRHEKSRYTGLAHLFEHMMFKETKNLKPGEFDRQLETAGAEGKNAFTSNDYTAYIQELPKHHLELIVRLEAERMTNLVVDEEAFKTEREVVHNERRYRKENNPAGIMYQELFATAFKKHPYRWPVIGYEDDLNRMNAKVAMDFYRRYYRPSRATIVVAGDVSSSEVLRLVNHYYGSIPDASKTDPVIDEYPQEPPQSDTRRKKLSLNLEVEKLYVAYKTPAITSPDAPVLKVLEAILSDGNSSRLTRGLVETEIATRVGSGNFAQHDPSIFLISVDLQKGQKSSVAESVILKELKRLRSQKVPEKELERAKNLVEFQFYASLASNGAKANFIGSHEITAGSYRRGLAIFEAIPEVTAEDIKRVVNSYFNPGNRTVITGVPKS